MSKPNLQLFFPANVAMEEFFLTPLIVKSCILHQSLFELWQKCALNPVANTPQNASFVKSTPSLHALDLSVPTLIRDGGHTAMLQPELCNLRVFETSLQQSH